MGAIDELLEAGGSRPNRHVAHWKAQGKPVVGYTCSYMPEELLHAAGILPYRITGKGARDTSRADAYLTRVNCTFSRCCLELALESDYDFLDGVVFVNGCDHIRRTFDNWKAQSNAPGFMHMLPVPHLINPEGLEWFREEVRALQTEIEGVFEVRITAEKLADAVATCNRTRRLLKELYDLRAREDHPLSGAESLGIVSAGSTMPKDRYNELLSQALEEVRSRQGRGDSRVRLVVAGSLMDDPEFLENVEALGAAVVSDVFCVGTRSFWDLTDEGRDAFDAITERYYRHVPCPRMAGQYARRLDFLKEQTTRTRAQGVILEHIKFCDTHGADNALLKRDLENAGLPVLELERQYGPLADAGRIRTRIQAFLERIRREI